MRNGANGAAGDRLREAQRRLGLWRLRCRRPGRIPAHHAVLRAPPGDQLTEPRRVRVFLLQLAHVFGTRVLHRKLLTHAAKPLDLLQGVPQQQIVARSRQMFHYTLRDGSAEYRLATAVCRRIALPWPLFSPKIGQWNPFWSSSLCPTYQQQTLGRLNR